MTDLVTIEVRRDVADQLRAAARDAGLSDAELIEEMLCLRRRSRFWAALESEVSDTDYLAEVEEADRAFDADGEATIAAFENRRELSE